MLRVCSKGHGCVDRGGERSAVGGLWVGVTLGKSLLLRLGGGRRGMGALTGTAAGLCAGTCLLHLPPLGERRLVHRLQTETFPLTFVKCLGQKRGEGGDG